MRAFRITVSATGDWACACASVARASNASKASFTGSFPDLTKDYPFRSTFSVSHLLQVFGSRFSARRDILKGRRCIHPQHPGLTPAGIFPAMRRGALEIKTVAGLKAVVF